jgi:hypothetical protein
MNFYNIYDLITIKNIYYSYLISLTLGFSIGILHVYFSLKKIKTKEIDK